MDGWTLDIDIITCLPQNHQCRLDRCMIEWHDLSSETFNLSLHIPPIPQRVKFIIMALKYYKTKIFTNTNTETFFPRAIFSILIPRFFSDTETFSETKFCDSDTETTKVPRPRLQRYHKILQQ